MEEEVDLREYLDVVLRHWWWILLIAVVMAVGAYIYSTTRPPAYSASAIVLVAKPRYDVQFENDIKTSQSGAPSRAYPTLATSDGILQAVIDTYEPPPDTNNNHLTIGRLRGIADASAEADPSLLALSIRSGSPEVAAAIVNQWADVLIRKVDEIYGSGQANMAFFEEQAAIAKETLDKTDRDMIEFEAQNPLDNDKAHLSSLRQTQENYLDTLRAMDLVVQDIEGLRAQIEGQAADDPVSMADSVTALALQIRAFNAYEANPIQLQIEDTSSFADTSREEQVALLDDLAATVQTRAEEVEGKLAVVGPQIMAMQQQVQEGSVAEGNLTRARDLARETYKSLARQVEEARITAQEESGVLRIGSYAAVPNRPSSRNSLFNVAVAGLLGLGIGVGLAFLIEYVRKSRAERQGQEE